MYFINVLLLAGGLILLVKGADLFVISSTSIAKRFGVSEFIIGLTLVSIGTSVPELASSLTASFEQASGIVIGNILGSNIANIGLIVSSAAFLSSIKTEELMLRRDGYIMLFSAFLFLLFALDFRISRIEALTLLLIYCAYLLFLLDKVKKHKEDIYFKDFMNYFLKFEYIFDLKARIETGVKGRIEEKGMKGTTENIEKRYEGIKESYEGTGRRVKTEEETGKEIREEIRGDNKICTAVKTEDKGEINGEVEIICKGSLLMEAIKLIAGGIAIIAGAKYFVEQSIFFALLLNVPETLVGISLVAVGTSIPELMVTISAARSGYASIALGNVIGSNITNILLILGFSGLVHPLTVTEISIFYVTPFMLLISLLLLFFVRTGWRIRRFEGLVLFLLYSGFMVMVFRLG